MLVLTVEELAKDLCSGAAEAFGRTVTVTALTPGEIADLEDAQDALWPLAAAQGETLRFGRSMRSRVLRLAAAIDLGVPVERTSDDGQGNRVTSATPVGFREARALGAQALQKWARGAFDVLGNARDADLDRVQAVLADLNRKRSLAEEAAKKP